MTLISFAVPEIGLLYRDTEGGHCARELKLSSPVVLLRLTESLWDGSAIYVAMQAMRNTHFPMLKGGKLISTNFAWVGIEPPISDLAGKCFYHWKSVLCSLLLPIRLVHHFFSRERL